MALLMLTVELIIRRNFKTAGINHHLFGICSIYTIFNVMVIGGCYINLNYNSLEIIVEEKKVKGMLRTYLLLVGLRGAVIEIKQHISPATANSQYCFQI